MSEFSEIIEAAKSPKVSGLALASWGMYTSQFAKNFPHELQVQISSWICLGAVGVGVLIFLRTHFRS